MWQHVNEDGRKGQPRLAGTFMHTSILKYNERLFETAE